MELKYAISNNEVIITGLEDKSKSIIELAIPSRIYGKLVTSIGEYAFANTRLANVVIPDSIKSIGDWAFDTCMNLTSVTIPNSVTTIGECAFGYYQDDEGYAKTDAFTIYGYKGTESERYANAHGFKFVNVFVSTTESKIIDVLKAMESEELLEIYTRAIQYNMIQPNHVLIMKEFNEVMEEKSPLEVVSLISSSFNPKDKFFWFENQRVYSSSSLLDTVIDIEELAHALYQYNRAFENEKLKRIFDKRKELEEKVLRIFKSAYQSLYEHVEDMDEQELENILSWVSQVRIIKSDI